MVINKNIKITINYRIQNDKTWHEFNIEVQDYFDKNYYEENEEVDIDSLPLYDHALHYISIEDKKSVKNTNLCIVDNSTNEKVTIKESYWNSQKNSVVERVDLDKDGFISNHEIIVTTLVQEDTEKKIWEVIRFSKMEDVFNPVFHSFITENEEELISEEIVRIG